MEHTAENFNEMCKATGLKKQALAAMVGRTPVAFSRYCTGKTPVPEAIWKLVEIEAKKRQ